MILEISIGRTKSASTHYFVPVEDNAASRSRQKSLAEMASFYNRNSLQSYDFNQLKRGNLVAVKTRPGVWRRGQVVISRSNGVKVLFIDTAEVELDVDPEAIFELLPPWTKSPSTDLVRRLEIKGVEATENDILSVVKLELLKSAATRIFGVIDNHVHSSKWTGDIVFELADPLKRQEKLSDYPEIVERGFYSVKTMLSQSIYADDEEMISIYSLEEVEKENKPPRFDENRNVQKEGGFDLRHLIEKREQERKVFNSTTKSYHNEVPLGNLSPIKTKKPMDCQKNSRPTSSKKFNSSDESTKSFKNDAYLPKLSTRKKWPENRLPKEKEVDIPILPRFPPRNKLPENRLPKEPEIKPIEEPKLPTFKPRKEMPENRLPQEPEMKKIDRKELLENRLSEEPKNYVQIQSQENVTDEQKVTKNSQLAQFLHDQNSPKKECKIVKIHDNVETIPLSANITTMTESDDCQPCLSLVNEMDKYPEVMPSLALTDEISNYDKSYPSKLTWWNSPSRLFMEVSFHGLCLNKEDLELSNFHIYIKPKSVTVQYLIFQDDGDHAIIHHRMIEIGDFQLKHRIIPHKTQWKLNGLTLNLTMEKAVKKTWECATPFLTNHGLPLKASWIKVDPMKVEIEEESENEDDFPAVIEKLCPEPKETIDDGIASWDSLTSEEGLSAEDSGDELVDYYMNDNAAPLIFDPDRV